MRRPEWRAYHDEAANLAPVRDHAERVAAADTLLFTYPTWWFGLPAMLKGWLDRVLVPGFAFGMPGPDHGPRPGLTHIRRVGVFTTCGASWTMSQLMGMPGRRTLLRGLRANCHPGARTCYHALYQIDSAPAAARAAFLERIPARVERLLGRPSGPASSLARRRLRRAAGT
jgi:putative NADPH-quinone reductase